MIFDWSQSKKLVGFCFECFQADLVANSPVSWIELETSSGENEKKNQTQNKLGERVINYTEKKLALAVIKALQGAYGLYHIEKNNTYIWWELSILFWMNGFSPFTYLFWEYWKFANFLTLLSK